MQSINTNVQSLIYAFKDNALDVLCPLISAATETHTHTHVSSMTQQTVSYKVKVVASNAALCVM